MKTKFLKIVSALMVAVMLLCSSPVGSAEYNSTVISSLAAAKKIKLKKTKLTLVTGETYTQKLLNEKGKAITKNVKWSTANKKTATVSSKGKVTAKKAGKVKITAKYKNKKYTFTVTVKNAVLSEKKKTLKEGKSFTLTLKGNGKKISTKNIKFKTSNKKVATVSSSGKVKGIAPGKATITATYKGKAYKCTVTVKGVYKLEFESKKLPSGTSFKQSLLDPDGKRVDNDKIMWNSDNTEVATVSSNGVVVGWKTGEATIYAIYKDEIYKSTVKVVNETVIIALSEAYVGRLVPIQLRDKSGSIVSNSEIKWSSDNEDVLIILPNGVMARTIAEGTATVTAEYKGKKYKKVITVTKAPDNVDVTVPPSTSPFPEYTYPATTVPAYTNSQTTSPAERPTNAPGTDLKKEILGAWEGGPGYLIFNEDGSMELIALSVRQKGAYTLKGDVLTIDMGYVGVVEWNIVIQGDYLFVFAENGDSVIYTNVSESEVTTRPAGEPTMAPTYVPTQSPATTAPSQEILSSDDLIGDWKKLIGKDAINAVSFYKDGSLEITDALDLPENTAMPIKGNYTLKNNVLTLTYKIYSASFTREYDILVTDVPVLHREGITFSNRKTGESTLYIRAIDAPQITVPSFDTTVAPGGASVPSSVAEVVAAYNKAINDAKWNYGAVTVHKLSNASVSMVDLPAVAEKIITPVLVGLTTPTDRQWQFENGRDSDGRRLSEKLPPSYSDCCLDESDVVSATATANSDGGYDIVIVLKEETAVFDGTSMSKEATSHLKAMELINPGQLDLGPIIISNADLTYHGATLKATVDSQGRLTRLVITNPVDVEATGKVSGLVLSATAKVQTEDTYELTYN